MPIDSRPLHITGSMISSERLTYKDDQTFSQAEAHTGLLDALQLIVRVPSETLLAHRREAVVALDRLCLVLSAQTLPGAVSSLEQFHPNVAALLKSLDQSQMVIIEHLSLSEVSAVGESPKRESREPRNYNIDTTKPADSSRHVTFRKGLTHRRRAHDYERWEIEKFETSRVNTLLRHLDQEKTSRDGYVNRFVSETLHDCQDEFRKDIQHGIKMLVFERLCQKTAVSAVLSFACTRFRCLKFSELPLLKIMLDKSPWIPKILTQKECWYQRCQEHYDAACRHAFSNTKRPTELDTASSEPSTKRLCFMKEDCMDKGIGTPAEAALLSSEHVYCSVTASQLSSHQGFPNSLSTIMSNESPFEIPMAPFWTNLNDDELLAEWHDNMLKAI